MGPGLAGLSSLLRSSFVQMLSQPARLLLSLSFIREKGQGKKESSTAFIAEKEREKRWDDINKKKRREKGKNYCSREEKKQFSMSLLIFAQKGRVEVAATGQ